MTDRILIADDETHVLQSMMRRLRGRGYDVTGVESGYEVLEKLQAESFDLLLLDIKMPDIGGLELLRRARTLNPDVAALMVTGYGNVENAVEAMELGALGLVRKPVPIQELTAAIEGALARVRLRRENARLRAFLPLFDVSRAFLSETDEEKLLSLMCESIFRELDADGVEILRWDEAMNLVRQAVKGLSVSEAPPAADVRAAADATARLEPLVVAPSDASDAGDGRAWPGQYSIYVPLAARKEAIGVVKVTRSGEDDSFSDSDVELLRILCGQGAVGLANARLLERVHQKQAEVESLLEEIVSTAERERMNLAMELHDGPVQSIVASHYEMQTCLLLIGHDRQDEAAGKVKEVQEMLGRCLHDLRGIVRDLSPPVAVEQGLIPAVTALLADLEKSESNVGHISVTGEVRPLGKDLEAEAYYVVREALANVRKHTDGADVSVCVDFGSNVLSIAVSDDGDGFDPDAGRRSDGGHLGIRSMEERARMMGGSLTIESAAGKGTRVTLTAPTGSIGEDGNPRGPTGGAAPEDSPPRGRRKTC